MTRDRGRLLKTVFLVYGLVWLGAAALLAGRLPRCRGTLIALAVGALWYLPFGTLVSLIQIAILATWRGVQA